MPTTTKGKQQIIGGIIEVLGDVTQPGKFVWLIHYPGDASADAATAPVLLGAPLGSIATSGEGTPDAWIKTAATTWVSLKGGAGGGGVTTYAALTDTNVAADTPGDVHTWNGSAWTRSYGVDWSLANQSASASGEEVRLIFGRDLTVGFGAQFIASETGTIAAGNIVGGLTLQDFSGSLNPRLGRYDNQNLTGGENKYAELVLLDAGDGFGSHSLLASSVNGSNESRLALSPVAALLTSFGSTGVTTVSTANVSAILNESAKTIKLDNGSTNYNYLWLGEEPIGATEGGFWRASRSGAALGTDSDGFISLSLGAAITDPVSVAIASRAINASSATEFSGLELNGDRASIQSFNYTSGSSARLLVNGDVTPEASLRALSGSVGGGASARLETDSLLVVLDETNQQVKIGSSSLDMIALTSSTGNEAISFQTGGADPVTLTLNGVLGSGGLNTSNGGVSVTSGTGANLYGPGGTSFYRATASEAQITATRIFLNSARISAPTIPAYADDTAAGAGGLVAGDFYQTDGTGASPLNVAGILMVKQ